MMAGAILAIIAGAAMTGLFHAQAERANARVRVIAAAEAQRITEQLLVITTSLRGYSNALYDAQTAFCDLATSPLGPLSPTGGTVSGTCPNISVTGVVQGTTNVRRTATMARMTFRDQPNMFRVQLSVTGARLRNPVAFETFVVLPKGIEIEDCAEDNACDLPPEEPEEEVSVPDETGEDDNSSPEPPPPDPGDEPPEDP